MAKTLIVRAGMVADIILATLVEAQSAFPDALVVDANVHPAAKGDGWNGAEVVPAPAAAAVVPEAVTMRQARLVLLAAGKLDAVQETINALSEPQKTQAQIAWDYSSEVQRHYGLVAQLGPALGLSDAQIDALFTQGAAL